MHPSSLVNDDRQKETPDSFPILKLFYFLKTCTYLVLFYRLYLCKVFNLIKPYFRLKSPSLYDYLIIQVVVNNQSLCNMIAYIHYLLLPNKRYLYQLPKYLHMVGTLYVHFHVQTGIFLIPYVKLMRLNFYITSKQTYTPNTHIYLIKKIDVYFFIK